MLGGAKAGSSKRLLARGSMVQMSRTFCSLAQAFVEREVQKPLLQTFRTELCIPLRTAAIGATSDAQGSQKRIGGGVVSSADAPLPITSTITIFRVCSVVPGMGDWVDLCEWPVI